MPIKNLLIGKMQYIKNMLSTMSKLSVRPIRGILSLLGDKTWVRWRTGNMPATVALPSTEVNPKSKRMPPPPSPPPPHHSSPQKEQAKWWPAGARSRDIVGVPSWWFWVWLSGQALISRQLTVSRPLQTFAQCCTLKLAWLLFYCSVLLAIQDYK